jgi:CheY-like chemotaxis protein
VHRILLVDDEPDILQSLRTTLPLFLDRPVEISIAPSAPAAIQKMAGGCYDLVITDERMPEMTGSDLLRWIVRACPGSRRILMTAFGGNGLHDMARQAGAQAVFAKPFNLEELGRTVQALLDRPAAA